MIRFPAIGDLHAIFSKDVNVATWLNSGFTLSGTIGTTEPSIILGNA